MDVGAVEQIASSQFVWAIAAILLVIAFGTFLYRLVHYFKLSNENRENRIIALYESQRQESRDREERLMRHLEKTTDTLDSIDARLTRLEDRRGE